MRAAHARSMALGLPGGIDVIFETARCREGLLAALLEGGFLGANRVTCPGPLGSGLARNKPSCRCRGAPGKPRGTGALNQRENTTQNPVRRKGFPRPSVEIYCYSSYW
jgi:hypothetical protein